MRRQVNRNSAAQTAAHRDDTFGIHLRTSHGVVVDRESVLEEFLFPGFAFALPVAAEVDDERRGRSVALYQPAAELDAIRGDDAHLFDVGARCRAGVQWTREEQHPVLEEPHEQRHADGDAEHDLKDRTDHQCSLTLGSVPRLRRRANVSSATPIGPWSAYRCILYSDRYISRANQPSTR